MAEVLEKKALPQFEPEPPCERYAVGQRVLWHPVIDDAGQYSTQDKLRATIVAAFQNGPGMSYKLRLDLVCNTLGIGGQRIGKPIVVANVLRGQLLPLRESSR